VYVTPIGFVLIPLSLAVLFFSPDDLGPWTVVLATFQAAAVISIEGSFPIGVTPYFFGLILIALRFVPQWISGRCGFGRSDLAMMITRPLLLLAAWSISSAFVLPWLFAGVGVNLPRAGMDSPETTPLRWSLSNAAQAAYIALNTIFVIHLLWQSRTPEFFERLGGAYTLSGTIACAIGAYQYIAHHSGLPYPVDFFNSNLGWRQLMEQQLLGVWRLSATFSEPSAAGAFFAVWSTMMLFLGAEDVGASTWAWPLFLMGGTMLLLTTSTTGYVTGGLVLGLFAWKQLARLLVHGTISIHAACFLLLIAVSLTAAVVFVPHRDELLTQILWQKAGSQSTRDRTATIIEARRIALETFGLGAGLGSNRPSGMFFYIASNLGIPGLIAFAATVGAIYRAYRIAQQSYPQPARLTAFLTAAACSCAIELFAMVSVGGDMSGPMLWVSLGILAAGSRTVWMYKWHSEKPIELQESMAIRPPARAGCCVRFARFESKPRARRTV
jgi:hypothetical protein